MAGNTVTLEFAGDADKLRKASKQAQQALNDVDAATAETSTAMRDETQSASRLEDRLGSLGAATSGATDAIDGLAGGLQAVADIADYSRARADRLARAEIDVEQALVDSKQATIDLRQSRIDLRQANEDAAQSGLDIKQAEIDRTQAVLDAKTAQDDYNEAVKEHGKGSDEAVQASIDLKQANQDVAQADADARQASIDYKQAKNDEAQATNDASQAAIDAKESQLNLNTAMHEANPPLLNEWAEQLGLIAPLLQAVVGVTSLVTAGTWLFNAALWASPITWIVIGIVALIAVIALLVWKWDWVKKKGSEAWAATRGAAEKAWNWLKKVPGWIGDAFSKVGSAISRPFIGAFNAVSDAWNSTVGSLSWTVPQWVPGIGGNSINVPDLPRYHTGIRKIPGAPGTEVPFMGLAGEQVVPSSQAAGGGGQRIVIYLDSDVLIDAIADGVVRRGGRGNGNVQLVLGGGRR